MRILLVVGETLIREALCELIRRESSEVEIESLACANDAQGLLDSGACFEVVLIEARQVARPAGAGFIGFVRRNPHARIVLLAGSQENGEAVAAAEGGIHGFAPRTLSGASLVAVLRLVTSGATYFPHNLLRSKSPSVELLTPREREVLFELYRGSTNKQIAKAIGVDEPTVKSLLRTVGQRLGAKTRTEIAMKGMLLTQRGELQGATESPPALPDPGLA